MPNDPEVREAALPKTLPSELATRLRRLVDGLLSGLVERDVAVRLALLAAVAGEHLLLIGPPGTAKSLIARRLHLAFADSTYFERLLTRFTVPEELFGPLSIKGLEEDRYERLTQAYLPTAGVAFLDEIFKANSAILNALLTLLNEREFDNGTQRVPTPLRAAVGASNELPAGDELDALFDRFLLRLHVGPVSKAGFPSLLGLRGESKASVPSEARLTTADLQSIRQAVPTVAVPDDVIVLLSELRDWCAAEKIEVSDRRWRKIVGLLQTSALTNGRSAVSIWDCWLLQHCLWTAPEQREKIYDWYAERAGASAAMDPSRLTRIVVSWEGRLKQDQESRSQARDSEGNLVFKAQDGAPTTDRTGIRQAKRGTDALYLAPANTTDRWGNQQQTLGDRTNGGKGYTESELDDTRVYDPNHGARHFVHWKERAAYLANKANWLTEENDLVPLMEPTRHKVTHIDSCLQEVRALRQQVEEYGQKLDAHIASLRTDICDNLWVTDDFIEPASQSLDGTRRAVRTLNDRIDKIQQGFEMLPREVQSAHEA